MKFPDWKGKTVAILASGPSMSRHVADQIKESNLPSIAINTTVRLAPWADVLYAADARWWHHRENLEIVANFQGLKVTADRECYRSDVVILEVTGRVGFDADAMHVRTGGNSGYQAIHIAANFGAKKILLCGYDMHANGLQMHWHSRHPEPMRNASDGIFAEWLKGFVWLVEPLKDRGIEVVNCTPSSALKAWPIVALEDMLAMETA